MTPQEAREAAAVMLAFADGKEIECRATVITSRWSPKAHDGWDWESFEYRVAPEPWTGKIWVHPAGDVRDESHFCGLSPKDAGWKLITAKEVGDE